MAGEVAGRGGPGGGPARLAGAGGDRAHALLDRREGRRGRWLTVRRRRRGCWPGRPPTRTRPTTGWTRPTRRRPACGPRTAPSGAGTTPAWRRRWPPTSAWPSSATATWAASRTSKASVLVTTEASRLAVAEALDNRWSCAASAQPAPGAGRARVRRGGLEGRPPPGRRGHPGPAEPLHPLRHPDPRPRRPEPLAGRCCAGLHRAPPGLLGVNARVVAGGQVRVGDRVRVTRPAVPAAPPALHRLGRGPRGGLGELRAWPPRGTRRRRDPAA